MGRENTRREQSGERMSGGGRVKGQRGNDRVSIRDEESIRGGAIGREHERSRGGRERKRAQY